MMKVIFWIVSLAACAMAIVFGMQAADYACELYPNVDMDFAIAFSMAATALFIGLVSNPLIFPHVFRTRGYIFRLAFLAITAFALMILSFPVGGYIYGQYTPSGNGADCG
jgi:hypothetical protein